MIAVIVATREAPGLHGLDHDVPIPLIPLCDRPFLQHIIENLLQWQIRQFEVILNHLPEAVESYFGDGMRWGCQIRYHLAGPHQDPEAMVERLVKSCGDSVLLGSADSLPDLTLQMILMRDQSEPVFLVHPAQDKTSAPNWSGWALLPAREEASVSPVNIRHGKCVISTHELSIRTGEDLLWSQREILEQKFPNVHISGQQIRPGVWISRSVSIPATAKLEGPLYIGANSAIGSYAQVGPCAVIGGNSIVGDYSTVVNSMVCPGTYVGEGLELDNIIVNQHHLVDLNIGTSLKAPEAFLFSSLTDHGLLARARALLDRLAAMLLLAALGPMLAVVAAVLWSFKRGAIVREEFVPTARGVHHIHWRHHHLTRIEWDGMRARTSLSRLLFEFTPSLWAVIKGQIALVGMKARRAHEIEQMPQDWKALYLKTKAGLITEADVVFGPGHSEDELYSSEAYYGATESFSRDLLLMGRYLSGAGSGSHGNRASQPTHSPPVGSFVTLSGQPEK